MILRFSVTLFSPFSPQQSFISALQRRIFLVRLLRLKNKNKNWQVHPLYFLRTNVVFQFSKSDMMMGYREMK